MAKQKDTCGKPGKTGFVVGAAGFAKISAVVRKPPQPGNEKTGR